MNTPGIIDIKDLYSEVVSTEEFIRIFNEERDTIEQVKIIPLRLGERGFGRIQVTRKYLLPSVVRETLTNKR
ncbi:MAG: hypothetical protein RMM98_08865 [Acidobacteriota bacterium]|nr:hypothetical protein [Blastocatellia bacterium]MDW8239714.1 hypothetical protein [Acidobacteriota bacterium]